VDAVIPPETNIQFLDRGIIHEIHAGLSHDEVDAWQSNLLNKMPAMTGKKFANVRRPCLAFMWDPSRQENHSMAMEFASGGPNGMSGGSLNGFCSVSIPIRAC